MNNLQLKAPQWHRSSWTNGHVVDHEGRTVCRAVTAELGQQIVIDHNRNAELLATLKEATKSLEYAAQALQAPEVSVFMDSLRGARAALAKAEDRS
jgi:hypothetical protein